MLSAILHILYTLFMGEYCIKNTGQPTDLENQNKDIVYNLKYLRYLAHIVLGI